MITNRYVTGVYVYYSSLFQLTLRPKATNVLAMYYLLIPYNVNKVLFLVLVRYYFALVHITYTLF